MKNRKLKAKKGMTLIEVIISVTLLSILIVPISGFMLSSLKNNISSEKKQEASYIGQKILEELKSYESISLKNDDEGYYFELLDGDKIYKNPSNNSFEGEIQRDIYGIATSTRELRNYKVNIKIQEDNTFKYEDINNLEINNNVDYKIDLIKNNEIRINDYEIKENNNWITTNDELKINDNVSIIFNTIENKVQNIKSINLNEDVNKIVIYINSSYTAKTNIQINNSNEEDIIVYKIEDEETYCDIGVTNNKGRLILYNQKKSDNSIGNMYIFSVTVSNNEGNILFESKSSSNIKIKYNI